MVGAYRLRFHFHFGPADTRDEQLHSLLIVDNTPTYLQNTLSQPDTAQIALLFCLHDH